MADRIKEIPKQIMEWWNKFTSRQRTIIICISAGIILALAILITAFTRPQYALLASCESTTEAAVVKDLLVGADITPKISDDGLQIQVLTRDLSDANLLLGANNIPVASYDIEKVFSGGFGATEVDKQKKYKLYCEGQLEEDLATYTFVKTANVQLTMPEDDGTLIAAKEDSFASIILELQGDLPEGAPASIARVVATAIGNDNTKNITIIDTNGMLLFSGEDDFSVAGSASNQLSVKQQAESMIKNEVKKVLLATNEFNNVEVASNLKVDFSSQNKTQHNYSAPEGRTEGMKSHDDSLTSDSTSGGGGVPGTDANTETTYAFQDDTNSAQNTSETSNDYLPNEEIISQDIPGGSILYDQSSLAVSAIKYRVMREEDAEAQGLLTGGVTWDQYKAANGGRTLLTVEPGFVTLVSKATGIAEGDITILAYEEPMFTDASGTAIQATDILQIALIIVILGLLAFVVLRSMRGEKKEPEEEALSVENLLQSTPEPALEDISGELKSQERQMVEKFVDENPEAVASLLRNWLSEDWG